MDMGIIHGWMDMAFGISLPDGGAESWKARLARFGPVLAGLVPPPGFTAAELPLAAAATRPAARDLSRFWEDDPSIRDICLRAGPELTDPDAAVRLYRKTLAECRALGGRPAKDPGPDGIGAAAGLGNGPKPISAFLLEFPPSFGYGLKERRHLDRLAKDLEGLPLVVAFFNPSWYSLRVIEALKERSIGLCLMDFALGEKGCAGSGADADAAGGAAAAGGADGGLPPRFDMATSDIAYLKFFGYGAEAADRGHDAARLVSWLPRLEALALQARKLRIIFQGPEG